MGGRPVLLDKKTEFLIWLDNPDKGKETRDELCERLKVHRNTLINWSQEARIARSLEQGSSEEIRTKRLLDELYKESTNPVSSAAKVKAIELSLRIRGLLVDKTENKNVNLNKQVTDDDLNRLADRAEAKLAAFRAGVGRGKDGLSGGPGLLPSEVCNDRGPNLPEGEGDPLGSMALSS